jgi:hypothetical protein
MNKGGKFSLFMKVQKAVHSKPDGALNIFEIHKVELTF